jgi:predicted nucleic acid-binding protein
MKYLLDTNVFREVGKAQPHANVQAWLETVDDAELALSALTVREVTKGIVPLRASKPMVATSIDARVSAVDGGQNPRLFGAEVVRWVSDVGAAAPTSDTHRTTRPATVACLLSSFGEVSAGAWGIVG